MEVGGGIGAKCHNGGVVDVPGWSAGLGGVGWETGVKEERGGRRVETNEMKHGQ